MQGHTKEINSSIHEETTLVISMQFLKAGVGILPNFNWYFVQTQGTSLIRERYKTNRVCFAYDILYLQVVNMRFVSQLKLTQNGKCVPCLSVLFKIECNNTTSNISFIFLNFFVMKHILFFEEYFNEFFVKLIFSNLYIFAIGRISY